MQDQKGKEMDLFSDFEDQFKKKYGWIECQYPFMSMLMDQILRNEVAGRNVRSKVKTRFLLKKSIFSFIKSKISFLQLNKSSPYKTVWVGKLERFPSLKESLVSTFKKMGYEVASSHKMKKGNLKDVSNYQSEALGSISIIIFYACANYLGPEFVLKKKLLMRFFDKVVERKCKKISALLKKNKIEFLIELDDQMPDKRILAYSAKDVGAKYYVFAHGYFLDRFAISVLPIRGDKLFVWTQAQLELISDPENSSKVDLFGVPYIDAEGLNLDSKSAYNDPCLKRKVLVVLPHINNIGQLMRVQADLNVLVLNFGDMSLKLHPLNHDIKSKFNFIGISLLDPLDELDYRTLSRFTTILGGASSVMILASSLGREVICFREWAESTIDEVFMCSFDFFINNKSEILLRETKKVPLIPSFEEKILRSFG